MTYSSVLQRTALLPHPDPALIGRFIVNGENVDFPVGEADMQRDAQWCGQVLRDYGIGRGDHILLSSHAWHCPWVDQIRSGATAIGAVYSNVEAWAWDANRMASFLSRFRIKMLIGLGADSLAALQGVGDINELLAGVTRILAHPDAVGMLRENGFDPGLITRVGPALALTAPSGDRLVVNDGEWLIESPDGEFVVTSRELRSARFDRQPTGVRGSVAVVTGAIRLASDS